MKFNIIIFLILLFCINLFAEVELPVGSHPPAIEFEHFPNRVYALVWRNWNLVEPARIAETIGAQESDIYRIAESMGLPPAMPIPADYQKRMYITILRRNWHLLPYDQLLTLLDISPEQMLFSLKEDDFLFHKFGFLKPECGQLKYIPPNKKAMSRANEIKQLVQKNFKDALAIPAKPRFGFLDKICSLDDLSMQTFETDSRNQGLRFIYSYFGVFGDPLINTELDPYPDGLLAKLAAHGVNGIWMHVVLNQLAPGGEDFPEFGERHQERLLNLRRIVDRAKKYGISVYLYMNEPRAMPNPFFKNRPEMAGVSEEYFHSMCTSNKKVLNWMSNALTFVFQQVPSLGGVFTITASENLTSCASHGKQNQCPRCSKRDYADIIVEVNKAIADGVLRGNPNAKVIVWDWGWYGHGDAQDIIAKLPKSVWFMSVSEWAKPINRGGVESKVGEYSISTIGPGPRAKRHWAAAKTAGLKTVAKVQFNNTWELSAVPWLPTLNLVAQHASNLAKTNIDGIMLSWSLGGYPSPNLEIANLLSQNPHADVEKVLASLALRRDGEMAVPFAVKAWTDFSSAFQQFPYDVWLVYKAPQQYGPANLLFSKPTGYSATMVGFPYDDLEKWRGPYPKNVFVEQFEKVAKGWNKGLDVFNKVIENSDADKKDVAKTDFFIAEAAYTHFASVANQGQFVIARDALLKENLAIDEKAKLKKQINTILDNEITLAKDLFEITRQDSRIGFEASNQYYYVEQDLMEKVINCEFVRQSLSK